MEFISNFINNFINVVSGILYQPWCVPLILLAGGITPENVFELVQKFNPELIDISGGTETVTGKKDYGKIDRIFEKISYGE